MKLTNQPIIEARLRWTGFVLEKCILDVRDDWQRAHLNCAPTSTVGSIVETWDELCITRLMGEQAETIGDILAQFDEKAEGLEGDLGEMVDKIADDIMKHADELEKLKDPPKEQLEKGIKAAIEKGTGIELKSNTGGKAAEIGKKFDAKQAKEIHDKTRAELREQLVAIAKNLKVMAQAYGDTVEGVGPRRAAVAALKSKEGKAAWEGIKELRKADAAKNAGAGLLGASFKASLLKLMTAMAKNLIPYGSNILDGWKMMKDARSMGGKIKGIFDKFKKSNAPPEDKFAAFAKTVAKGPDKDLGEFADALQLNDDAEKLVDDRLEVKYIEDYVDKLRNMPPETPISEFDINDLITQWVKEQGIEQAAVKVDKVA